MMNLAGMAKAEDKHLGVPYSTFLRRKNEFRVI